MPTPATYTLSALPGGFALSGAAASLENGWGGDGVFVWVTPEIEANVFPVAATDANVSAPNSIFRWE